MKPESSDGPKWLRIRFVPKPTGVKDSPSSGCQVTLELSEGNRVHRG